ncbi:glycoside hydrolase family 2 protein [uncultured Algibacter sp.]|uniref:beta-mannosidase n=1 Tax=uncultured Algibacter sp. TaxID=298659 RepID=UPI0025F2B24F|nr:glycoside hydrolase family 2 protein [uncultured Algibacter sp.]
MKYSGLLVIMIFLIGCSTKNDVPIKMELHDNWEFKKVRDTLWNLATVPGNIHSDLLENKLIEHPFIGNNEEKLQWISKTDWDYKTTFLVDRKTLQKRHIELSFEGLDTYASVFLNDSLILKTNNAFREFQVEVKSILKAENELRIVFENTSISEDKEKNSLKYTLPEGNRIFTRKAQFQYGWDWGPKLNTSGIWRPIKLTAWNDYKIENINIIQKTLTDSIASLIVEIADSNFSKDVLNYEVYINDTLQFQKPEKPEIPITIKNSKRWWPHNLGEPYLYDIKVVVRNGKTILDSVLVKKGLRTIDLITEKDSIGESFYFKVNDVPVYAKGANYIPQNSMQNQVTNAHYEKLLNDVVDANMNMLRVWGGGIYENDIFYDLCDEKGILVWQDFMFACAMYPGDQAFLENVQEEATQNVKRLRNHASIALWCGNNENAEGWNRWGWQADRSEHEKEEIWSYYLKVFDSILPNTVDKLTDTDYWESSPKYGRGNPKYKFEGDAHDWWIWHDAYPFEHLEENVPRFMSEFGFQSFPSYEAIKYINQSDLIDISTYSFQSHQKHSRGFQLIREYMERDFPVPEKAEDYVYMSQLLQAYGITKGIEAQRRAKPYNMGTLYWQLNDCWPVVSWSSIDFFGKWKALHYKAKHSFEDVLVSSKVENNILRTYVINDDFESHSGELSVKILDFEGNPLYQFSKSIILESNASQLQHQVNLEAFKLDASKVVVVSNFNNSQSLYYLVKPKELKLKQVDIEQKITKTDIGFSIELSSKTLQKDVFLYSDEKGHFLDNYFDLLPNETKIVVFQTKSKTIERFNIKTFNTFIR